VFRVEGGKHCVNCDKAFGSLHRRQLFLAKYQVVSCLTNQTRSLRIYLRAWSTLICFFRIFKDHPLPPPPPLLSSPSTTTKKHYNLPIGGRLRILGILGILNRLGIWRYPGKKTSLATVERPLVLRVYYLRVNILNVLGILNPALHLSKYRDSAWRQQE
jgi:hypothetical protein